MNTLTRLAARAALAGLVVVGALLALAGCDTAAPAAPPTTVVVNTPPTDGGMAVLLTVVIVLAVLALVGAAGFACAWSHERRTRREAESTVYALTGHRLPHSSTRAVLAVAPDADQLLALDTAHPMTERNGR